MCKVCEERHSVRGEIAIVVYGITRHICRRCVAKVERALEERKGDNKRQIIG